jgi:hypothetical protein
VTAPNPALIEAAAAARIAEKEAKTERGRAMDAMIELLLERAEARLLLRKAANALFMNQLGTDIDEFLDRTG